MPWVKDFKGLVDFLSLVIVHAPDGFPKEDYLADDLQLTLDRAFAELRSGMKFALPRITDRSALDSLGTQLEQSLAMYRLGDDIEGAHVLQEFEQNLLRAVR